MIKFSQLSINPQWKIIKKYNKSLTLSIGNISFTIRASAQCVHNVITITPYSAVSICGQTSVGCLQNKHFSYPLLLTMWRIFVN